MSSTVRFARSATLAVGVISLLAAAPAGAQRGLPRIGVAAPPPQSPAPRFPTGTSGMMVPLRPGDPRLHQRDGFANRRFQQRLRGSQIVLVPYPIGGYYDGSYGAGQVYDVNGRPLSATFDQMSTEPMPPSVSYGYGYAPGYTPDLTGSPYAITDEGMMAVDFPNGERRAFPACAAQADLRDPQGRPRTIFYQQSDYWMILRPGQRGRVQGDPPAPNAKACYAIDSTGRVVLRQ